LAAALPASSAGQVPQGCCCCMLLLGARSCRLPPDAGAAEATALPAASRMRSAATSGWTGGRCRPAPAAARCGCACPSTRLSSMLAVQLHCLGPVRATWDCPRALQGRARVCKHTRAGSRSHAS
jgi:hypothetical protein